MSNCGPREAILISDGQTGNSRGLIWPLYFPKMVVGTISAASYRIGSSNHALFKGIIWSNQCPFDIYENVEMLNVWMYKDRQCSLAKQFANFRSLCMCAQFERLPGIYREEVWLYDPGRNRKDGTSKHLRLRGLVLRGPGPAGAWHTNICRSGGRELRHRGLGCFRRQRHVRRDLAWLRGRLAAWWPGGEDQRHFPFERGDQAQDFGRARGAAVRQLRETPRGWGRREFCHSWW